MFRVPSLSAGMEPDPGNSLFAIHLRLRLGTLCRVALAVMMTGPPWSGVKTMVALGARNCNGCGLPNSASIFTNASALPAEDAVVRITGPLRVTELRVAPDHRP